MLSHEPIDLAVRVKPMPLKPLNSQCYKSVTIEKQCEDLGSGRTVGEERNERGEACKKRMHARPLDFGSPYQATRGAAQQNYLKQGSNVLLHFFTTTG